MSLTVFRGTAKLMEGMAVECQSGDHKFVLDEPKELGGSDTGMNPVAATLCALGACQAIVASCYAKAKGIELEEYWVEVEGDLDVRGFQGDKTVKPGIQAIRCKSHVKAKNSRAEIEEFVKFVEETCPVGDTIKNSAPISSEIVIEG